MLFLRPVSERARDPEFEPCILEAGGALLFPDPRLADAEGLVAVGGDLSVPRLLYGYERGVFPWYDQGFPPFWWSPDPRCVLLEENLHISRSLDRRMRRGGFQLSWNRNFSAVIKACAKDREEGTWIIPEMIAAYQDMHEAGHAHSLEVWIEDDLVAGLYGVHRGGLFAAESMFTCVANMSKLALVAAVRSLYAAGIQLFDVQFQTEHLASMGAVEWTRDEYLARLAKVVLAEVDLSRFEPRWQDRTQ